MIATVTHVSLCCYSIACPRFQFAWCLVLCLCYILCRVCVCLCVFSVFGLRLVSLCYVECVCVMLSMLYVCVRYVHVHICMLSEAASARPVGNKQQQRLWSSNTPRCILVIYTNNTLSFYLH